MNDLAWFENRKLGSAKCMDLGNQGPEKPNPTRHVCQKESQNYEMEEQRVDLKRNKLMSDAVLRRLQEKHPVMLHVCQKWWSKAA